MDSIQPFSMTDVWPKGYEGAKYVIDAVTGAVHRLYI